MQSADFLILVPVVSIPGCYLNTYFFWWGHVVVMCDLVHDVETIHCLHC